MTTLILWPLRLPNSPILQVLLIGPEDISRHVRPGQIYSATASPIYKTGHYSFYHATHVTE